VHEAALNISSSEIIRSFLFGSTITPCEILHGGSQCAPIKIPAFRTRDVRMVSIAYGETPSNRTPPSRDDVRPLCLCLSSLSPRRAVSPQLLFLCQCIVGSRPQLPTGPPCVRAPIRKPRHTTWPCTRICTHEYWGGQKGGRSAPSLTRTGPRLVSGGMQIHRKRVSTCVRAMLNFQQCRLDEFLILIFW